MKYEILLKALNNLKSGKPTHKISYQLQILQ